MNQRQLRKTIESFSPKSLTPARSCRRMLKPTGTIIGPFPHFTFRRESVVMAEGDVLLVYTDGVSETMDTREALYTENQLCLDLDELHPKTPLEIARSSLERVQKHGV